MTTILVGALLIGITLGLLGSGGSTITVPVLVYLVGHTAKVSIAESMAIVGIISLVAAIPYALSKQVDWRSVVYFGIPGMVGTFGGAWLGGLATDAIQLIVFGTVLLLAAVFMFKEAFGPTPENETKPESDSQPHSFSMLGNIKIAAEGIVVGVLTGFVGVGGGFLIVPALVVFGKLPMRLAIGTSLVIIVFKSAIGFAKYQHYLLAHDMTVDWQTIFIFGVVGIVGSFAGQKLNSYLNQRTLQQVFAVFLVVVGCFVVVREGNSLLNSESQTSSHFQTVKTASPGIEEKTCQKNIRL